MHSGSIRSAAGALAVLVAGACCYGLFIRRGMWLTVIGYSVGPSERVLNGEVPYRDFVYNYTPGTLWLNALAMKWFGPAIPTVNATIYVFKTLTLLLLFFAASRLRGSLIALIPVAMTLAWIGHKHIYAVVPTQYSLLFLLMSLVAMLAYYRKRDWGWLIFSGLATGLVFTFKYNVGVILLACGTAAVFTGEVALAETIKRGISEGLKRSSFLWIGFGVIAGLMFFYLAASGALGPMLDHFAQHAGRYSDERAAPLPSPKFLLPVLAAGTLVLAAGLFLARRAPRLIAPFLVGIVAIGIATILFTNWTRVEISTDAAISYLPPALFLATFLLVSMRWRKTGREACWKEHGGLIITGWFALAAYLEMYPRADEYHLVRILPPVFLLLTIFAVQLKPFVLSRLKEWRIERPERMAAVSLGCIFATIVALGVDNTWLPQFDSNGFIDAKYVRVVRAQGMRVAPEHADFIERLDSVIRENSGPGSYMFSFTKRGTAFNFLSERINPTRIVWWQNVGIRKEDRDQMLEALSDRRLSTVLFEETLLEAEVLSRITGNYDEADNIDGIRVMIPKLPPQP